jgi:hypothetical protein
MQTREKILASREPFTHDPIIGQAPGNSARRMDEPFPNYPAGSRRTTLAIREKFLKLTAAAYFFMPSITALRTVLTASRTGVAVAKGGDTDGLPNLTLVHPTASINNTYTASRRATFGGPV